MDIGQIRELVKDYYGTAMQYHPNAMGDLSVVDSMSDEEVLQEAVKLHIIEIKETDDDLER